MSWYEKNKDNVKDQFGQKISLGTILTYPRTQSSSCWMNTMLVTEIIGPDPKDKTNNPDIRLKGLIQVDERKWIPEKESFSEYETFLKKVNFYSPYRSTVVTADIVNGKYPLLVTESLKY